ncbi:dihydrouridine synthase domain-containing protein, putative [Eimeria brunetti]|uniref:Dihydrouridine synthase domain-containing protein, putative n=1 Tax=Eimeria brunetti TaxID=51314 RepID=U6LJM2_9EIME|nr:dihydrouridine synthase domain-containing protein, putative [Eimeria brunetti]
MRTPGSEEPAACESLPGSSVTEKHAESDSPHAQAPTIEQSSHKSTLQGSGQGIVLSKSESNDTQGQDHCPQKRRASQTTACTESQGATDEGTEGKGAAGPLHGGDDTNSGLQPRPTKCPKSVQEQTCGDAAAADAVETANKPNEKLHLTNAGGSTDIQEEAHTTDSAEGVVEGSAIGEPSSENRHCRSPLPPELYQSAWILAPMVRISTLPFRLECLKYGADIVYSEEIVDRKLIDSKRYINKDFGTVEYIHTTDRRCVFSTCEHEQGKVVLQLGTANATRALQAANVVMQDIAAVDVNMGCPKSFSVKGGMGAALLQTPDVAMDILKTLTRNVTCPVTCKIRLLETLEETVDFARKCESTGIAAIAVHARKRHERPAHRANWQAFPVLQNALKIPLIANGDFLSAEDAVRFQEAYGIRSLMFARGAMWDPSLFAHKKAHEANATAKCSFSRTVVLQDYIKRAVLCGAPYQSIKFTLQEMTARDSDRDLKLDLVAANSTAKICTVFGLDDFYSGINHVPYANTLNYYKYIDLE